MQFSLYKFHFVWYTSSNFVKFRICTQLHTLVCSFVLRSLASLYSYLKRNYIFCCVMNNKNRIVNFFLLRKEVIQPHLPIRLPCYDFTPVTKFTLGSFLLRWLTDFGCPQLPWCDGRCVQDPGTHSPQHSDLRLLVTPTSCRRVSAYNPNLDCFFQVCSALRLCFSLLQPL